MNTLKAEATQETDSLTKVDVVGNTWTELRVPILVITLLICCFIFVKVLPLEPMMYHTFTRPFQHDTDADNDAVVQRLRAKDQVIGTRLPLPNLADNSAIQAQATNVQQAKPTLLMVVSSCTGCMLNYLKNVEGIQAKHPGINVVAISPTPASDIEKLRKAQHLQLPIISDPERHLINLYNAAWMPRVYLLDQSGVLLWRQDHWRFDSQKTEQAIQQLVNDKVRRITK